MDNLDGNFVKGITPDILGPQAGELNLRIGQN